MAISMALGKLTLLFLSALGFYTTLGLFLKNGSGAQIRSLIDDGPHVLPGTDVSLKRSYTGIGRIDQQVTLLVVFFWPIVDGSLPCAAMNTLYVAGQFVSAWVLVMLEGSRKGNQGGIVTYVTIWGLLMQTITFAVTAPLLFFVHLMTSLTVASPRRADISVEPSVLASIPFAAIAGFIGPSVALALPAPSILDFDRKQDMLALWQAFPIWTQLLLPFIPRGIPNLVQTAKNLVSSPADRDALALGLLRRVYAFALLLSAIPYYFVVIQILASKYLSDSQFAGMLDFRGVFVPSAFSAETKMPLIGHGAHNFIQWDCLVGSTAVVIWASILFRSAYSAWNFPRWVALAVANCVLSALVGPAGCAVILIWIRDEIIYDKEEMDKKLN